jgi:hypothetical protein
MKIELPVQAQDYKLTDREKIFCFLMTQVSKGMENSTWKSTEFQFYNQDVNTILGEKLAHRKRVLNIFTIGRFNEYTCRVRWIKPMPVHHAGVQARYPQTYWDEITDESVFPLFMYLLGRLYDTTSLFNENQDIGLYKSGGIQNWKISEIYRSSPAAVRGHYK